MYASAQTLVRPCSEKKLLISELETNSCPFLKKSIYGWTLVRHLALPGDEGGSFSLLNMVGEELGTDVHMSLMGQYFPRYKALDGVGKENDE